MLLANRPTTISACHFPERHSLPDFPEAALTLTKPDRWLWLFAVKSQHAACLFRLERLRKISNLIAQYGAPVENERIVLYWKRARVDNRQNRNPTRGRM
jgi:hypothetical protein